MVVQDKWLVIMTWFLVRVTASPGPRCPPTAAPDHCREIDYAGDEYFYVVSGNNIKIAFDGLNYYMTCPENVSLENEFLPKFETEVIVGKVRLDACAPPDVGYRIALARLNVSIRYILELTNTPDEPRLGSSHFTGLNLTALVIDDKESKSLLPEPNFLDSLVSLRDLRLRGVTLESGERLPSGLRTLELTHSGLTGLSADDIARMPNLTTLILAENGSLRLELTGSAVRSVFVTAPRLQLWPGGAENVTLTDVVEQQVRGPCGALRRLTVVRGAGEVPLARCAGLRALALLGPRAPAPPPAPPRRLALLRLRRLALTDLPPHWLADAAELLELDLSFNQLETLPLSLFVGSPRLQRLELSHNRLRRGALAALAPLAAAPLHTLRLDGNPLGDLCAARALLQPNAESPLRELVSLRRLGLARSGATRLCPDWRRHLSALEELDLSYNNITRLEYSELEWQSRAVRVSLAGGAPVTELVYSRAEYEAALRGGRLVEVRARWRLACDCTQYWAARALRERPQHAAALAADARCADGAPLAGAELSRLVCEVTGSAACPARCRCAASPAGAELRCGGAGLARAPAAPLLPPPRALFLPGNNITALDEHLFTPTLQELDVSDNRLEWVPAAAAASGRRVWLGGNPLRCDCRLAPLLRALAARPAALVDPARAACSSGPLLTAARPPYGCPEAGAPLAHWLPLAAGGALLLLATAAAAALARPALRHRLKRFLFERGPWPGWLEPERESAEEAAARPFDAFVSYSHRDAAFAYEVVARLEAAGRRRVCLHERDWPAGEWIPAQIAASVRRSRRTLVLLSEHFLRSRWARAEFREAYAAALGERRPRLLLLLLPGLAPAAVPAAEPELRAYLARATYLRWDEPRFWQRLERAVPPRANSAPPAA